MATKAVEAAVIPKRLESVKFVKDGVKTRLRPKTAVKVNTERKWQVHVRVDRTLPFEIAVSCQRSDLVLVDEATKMILL